MPTVDLIVLIPESTRKVRGGANDLAAADAIAGTLSEPVRSQLVSLRAEIREKSPAGWVKPGGSLPAYRRFDGNMYRNISEDAWTNRDPNVEVVIASGLLGLVASRDTVPAYAHSMAEPMPPVGKLNRWWRDHGLPSILEAYLRAVRPRLVVDLLSLEYRDAVTGYAQKLSGIDVKAIDYPGMGRGSQPLRGEKIAEILRTGRA